MKLQLTHPGNHGGGFFSCCSVACYDIIKHIKEHQSVPEVDFSKMFKMYKDFPDQNVYNMCFKFNESQELTFENFDNNRKEWLNLISPRQFNQLFE